MDLVIVAGMQRIEHYEIAAYRTDIALAKAVGERELRGLAVVDAGGGEANRSPLTEATEQHIIPAALGSDITEGKEPSDRKKASGGRAKAAKADEDTFICPMKAPLIPGARVVTLRRVRYDASSAVAPSESPRAW